MKNYYVLSNGRVRRESNTLYVENSDGAKRPLPIEDVDALYLYGEVDLNTRLLNFLSQKRVPLHVFNYYGFYSGSYYPREYLHSGFLLVHQVRHYSDQARRMALAREIVRASAHSLLRTVSYYERRKGQKPASADTSGEDSDRDPPGEITPAAASEPGSGTPTDTDAEEIVDASLTAMDTATDLAIYDNGDSERDPLLPNVDFDAGPVLEEGEAEEPASTVSALTWIRATIEGLADLVPHQTEVNALRGVEGKMRERYYHAWRHILSGSTWEFERRVRRPPDNEINALISFGNSYLYAVCLSEIYRTQLTPTISYLHEPGARRFSLALDLSEIFKPLLVDRAIFRLLNTGQLKPSHFDRSLDGCYLTDAGKRLFLAALEERLTTTLKHRRLGRSVSYRHLIRLECYKLIRHLTGIETYRAFRAWW